MLETTTLGANNKWAVILSGGISPTDNHSRYRNDCEEIYKTIVSCYGYPKSNIKVLIADGLDSGLDENYQLDNNGAPLYRNGRTDLDGDGMADVNYSATLQNLTTVFTSLGQYVSAGDDVFVFVTDHGDGDGSDNVPSTIYLWNDDVFSVTQFAYLLNKIPSSAHLHIVLGQCYSGGFINGLAGVNRTITTACRGNELSSSFLNNNPDYDEFVYHWTSAVRGSTPSGTPVSADTDNDGIVTIYEAYQNAAYSLLCCPNTATISWSNSSQIFRSSTSSKSGSLQNLSNEPYDPNGYLSVSVSMPGDIVYQLTKQIRLWKPGTFYNSPLLEGYYNNDMGSFYLDSRSPDASGYFWSCDASGWEPDFQGYYFTDFVRQYGSAPNQMEVSVNFNNPFGESTTLRRYFTKN